MYRRGPRLAGMGGAGSIFSIISTVRTRRGRVRDVAHRSRSRLSASVASSVAVAVMLAGCMSVGRPLSDRPDAASPSPGLPDDVSGIELPLDWFARQQVEAAQKEAELYFGFLERCLAEAGFEWEAPATAETPEGWSEAEWVQVSRLPGRYGVITMVQATKSGYDRPHAASGAGGTDTEADTEDLPEDPAERQAFLEAFFGTEAELDPSSMVVVSDPLTGDPVVAYDPSERGRGCKGRANRWLRGELTRADGEVLTDPTTTSAWLASTVARVFQETLADPRVVQAATEWRRCMIDHGGEFPEWRYPGGLAVGRAPGEGGVEAAGEGFARTAEIATADVECQEEVEWLRRLRSVEREYQQDVVERLPELFAGARELLDAYAERLATLRLEDVPLTDLGE